MKSLNHAAALESNDKLISETHSQLPLLNGSFKLFYIERINSHALFIDKNISSANSQNHTTHKSPPKL
jgi:hypothetical protein